MFEKLKKWMKRKYILYLMNKRKVEYYVDEKGYLNTKVIRKGLVDY